jgi:hypothetical protein
VLVGVILDADQVEPGLVGRDRQLDQTFVLVGVRCE